jgi:Ca2+/Na+ antiporter
MMRNQKRNMKRLRWRGEGHGVALYPLRRTALQTLKLRAASGMWTISMGQTLQRTGSTGMARLMAVLTKSFHAALGSPMALKVVVIALTFLLSRETMHTRTHTSSVTVLHAQRIGHGRHSIIALRK